MAKRPRTASKAATEAPAAASAKPPAAASTATDDAAPASAAAATASPEAKGFDMDGRTLRIRSLAPGGRRRAGRAFGPEPVDIEADDLDASATAALLLDPQLVVEVVGRET